jgi:hypothetical protein
MSSGIATIAAFAGTTAPESFINAPISIITPNATIPGRSTGERS